MHQSQATRHHVLLTSPESLRVTTLTPSPLPSPSPKRRSVTPQAQTLPLPRRYLRNSMGLVFLTPRPDQSIPWSAVCDDRPFLSCPVQSSLVPAPRRCTGSPRRPAGKGRGVGSCSQAVLVCCWFQTRTHPHTGAVLWTAACSHGKSQGSSDSEPSPVLQVQVLRRHSLDMGDGGRERECGLNCVTLTS